MTNAEKYRTAQERAENLKRVCGLIRGYVRFVVANEEAVEGDLFERKAEAK